LGQSTNQELGDILNSLVLLKLSAGEMSKVKKTIATVEYLVMRRLHSFTIDTLAKIIFVYSHLARQSQSTASISGNLSLIKSLEAILQQKWEDASD
jgi:hypothetical protein